MRKLWLVIGLVFGLNSLGVSQKQTDDYKKGEFFAGYSSNSVVDDSFFVVSRGFNVSGVYNVTNRLGIKGDVSQSFGKTENVSYIPFWDNPTGAGIRYSSKDSITNFVGGVQLKNNSSEPRFKPFGHVMGGVGQYKIQVRNTACTTPANCSLIPVNETDTGFSLIIGGGLDIKVSNRIDVRVVQIDVNSISFMRSVSSREGMNTFRFAAGIVFK